MAYVLLQRSQGYFKGRQRLIHPHHALLPTLAVEQPCGLHAPAEESRLFLAQAAYVTSTLYTAMWPACSCRGVKFIFSTGSVCYMHIIILYTASNPGCRAAMWPKVVLNRQRLIHPHYTLLPTPDVEQPCGLHARDLREKMNRTAEAHELCALAD